MDFVENIRVGQESAETGLGAEVDRAAAVFDARKVRRIGVAKDAPAEGDKRRAFFGSTKDCCHFRKDGLPLQNAAPSPPTYDCTSAMKTSNGLIVNP